MTAVARAASGDVVHTIDAIKSEAAEHGKLCGEHTADARANPGIGTEYVRGTSALSVERTSNGARGSLDHPAHSLSFRFVTGS